MRKIKDKILQGTTYASTALVVLFLVAIICYILFTGGKNFQPKMFTSDYYETPYFIHAKTESNLFHYEDKEEVFYSSNWGIGIKDTKDLNGKDVIQIVELDNLSPLKNATNKETNEEFVIKKGLLINRITIKDEIGNTRLFTADKGAKAIRDALDTSTILVELYLLKMGGGIRGSLLSTLYLILITLLMVIPLGVITAIYFTEIAKKNKINQFLLSLIDMISGIPSIIFGLLGLICFIPIVSKMTGSGGGSILAGAFTMTLMLLPVVIKTTMEAIMTIPESYKYASLALGASMTQTIFKVILPNSIRGILTSILLATGRIIGESAALIFAIGTYISDHVSLSGQSTTLAVHIWTLMSGDNPNYASACSISIVILIVVFILNLSIKLISLQFDRRRVE
ncbi:phosphate ABC transporter permease protein PstA [Coprobacillus sp. CAG:826]|nr:phosphate ABC transporter permease protein PstA [Coprobacillus sp. CAG:826]